VVERQRLDIQPVRLDKEQNIIRAQQRIADNRIGLPPGFVSLATTSMGMQLINTLVAQIDGTLHILNQGGLSLMISFETTTPFIP
jgi:two-component system, sensor histidine kinase PdtaS